MYTGDATAVVLAAGEGRRLSPLTNTRPKPMLPVANRPLLEYVLDALISAGIEDIVFVVGYRQERIKNHFGDGDAWDCSITYAEQDSQLGTGHALLQAEDAVSEPFLVLNGDRIIDPSLIHRVADRTPPTMSITHAEFPSTFGVVETRQDHLVHIEEKPIDPSPRALINAGVYLFDQSIFDTIRNTPRIDGELPLTATLNRIAEDVSLVRYDGTWLDLTYLWDLPVVNAMQTAASRADPADSSTDRFAQDVQIADTAHIDPNATVHGGTALGPNTRVDATAVISHSVLFPDCVIGAGSVLKDAVIGANVSIGPNATIEGGDASVPIAGSIHEGVTLGAVIGDNTDIGGGTVIAPGTVIGNDVEIESGARLSGIISPGTLVRRG